MITQLVQTVNDTIKKQQNEMHTSFPAKIVSVDTSKGTAEVQPIAQFKKPNGEKMDFPQISGVPIVFPQGNSQNSTIAFPVKEGDQCLIIVAEQSLDKWMYDRETDTDLKFDISNAICIPGMFSDANSIFEDACNQNAIIICNGSTKITVSDSKVKIDGDVQINGKLNVTGNITNSGNVVTSGLNLNSHTHTGNLGAETSGPH